MPATGDDAELPPGGSRIERHDEALSPEPVPPLLDALDEIELLEIVDPSPPSAVLCCGLF